MAFHTTQHEGLQDHMQAAQLMFIQLAAFVLRGILNILREPLVELVVGIEQTGHDEVKQSP